MKTYIGTKVVKAEPMTDTEFRAQKGMPSEKISLNAPGYFVEYEDGYKSWSPKEVFERCYREVSSNELRLLT